MQPCQKILIAVDFSENSKEAFRAACSVASDHKTRIFVLHVAEPNWVPEEPIYFGQQAIQYYAKAPDQAYHEAIMQKMREVYVPSRRIDVQYQTRQGDASQQILRMAEEIDSDLIVVGTHGRAGLRALLAGSVATAVLRGSHCPVLALKSAERPREIKKIRAILHPTDFSVDSDAALSVARSLAREHQARLILLHVATLDVFMDETAAAEIDPRTYRDALEDLSRRISRSDSRQPVETLLTRGFAAESIVETAEDLGCDLIVMGTHGRTGLTRLLMGSVAEHVLRKANCPVLILKAARAISAQTSDRPSELVLGAY